MPDGSRHMTSREVAFLDAVGRQVEDRRRVVRHLEQRPQVAELEAAVDQDGPLLELAMATARLKAMRRLAHAALRREQGVRSPARPVVEACSWNRVRRCRSAC